MSETKTQMDFAVQYHEISDDAILQLAAEGGLMPEAEAAIQMELRQRSLKEGDVQAFREKLATAELQIRIGNNAYDRGFGLRFRGRKFLSEDDRHKGVAAVTRWFDFFYMPLIPLGSYRVMGSKHRREEKAISKVELQWDQVFDGWKRAGLILLGFCALIYGFVVWDRFVGH